MRADVRWTGAARFVGETDSGHEIVMDGPPHAGGQNQGARPMEMVLLGLGGCSAFDVVHILQRGRHAVDDCSVHIEAERAETDPKVFTRIHMVFRVRGHDLTAKAVERAVTLSAQKYCSVARMLAHTAQISHEWHLEADA